MYTNEITQEAFMAKMYRADMYPGGYAEFSAQMKKVQEDLTESDRLYAISNPKRVGGLLDKFNAICTADAITANQIADLVHLASRKLESAQESYASYLEDGE